MKVENKPRFWQALFFFISSGNAQSSQHTSQFLGEKKETRDTRETLFDLMTLNLVGQLLIMVLEHKRGQKKREREGFEPTTALKQTA